MASWVSLNVEPDDIIEDEVDDTKELQIEEALKLYQTALKLHSQGPEFYTQAAEAYESLLSSEIFKYPESISDFKRAAESDAQVANVADEESADTSTEFNVNDSTSSLFQTLYLSYKNYGKYLLDSVHETIRTAAQDPETVQKTFQASRQALGSFADALERDDTDLNLWRQSARLSSALKSYRLNRFCLESVLADDDNRLEIRPELLGLEEIFSEDRLRATLTSLFDGLSASQVPVKKTKKALAKYLKQHEDPYPYLPDLPTEIGSLSSSKGPLALSTSRRREIAPSDATWDLIGKAILQALDDEEAAPMGDAPSRSFYVTLPTRESELLDTVSVKMEGIEDDPKNKTEESKTENGDIDMLDEAESLKEANQVDEPKELPEDAPQEPAETTEITEPTEEQSSFDQNAEKQLMESLEGHSVPAEQQLGEEEPEKEHSEPKSPIGARKRSSASAANDDPPEGGRMKSRRTRARESNADALVQPEEVAFDQEKYYEDRLEIFVNADQWMFNTLGSSFSKAGVPVLGTIEDLREKVATLNELDEVPQDPKTRLFQDMRGIIKHWNDEKSRLMQQKDDPSLKGLSGSNKSGLAVFLEHSRKTARRQPVHEQLPSGEEIYSFAETINNANYMHPHDVSFEWLRRLLMPQFGEHVSEFMAMKSAYTSFLWPQEVKKVAVDLLLREDAYVLARLCENVTGLERRVLGSDSENEFKYDTKDFADVEMIQAIYEIQLDIFSSVESLSNEAGQQNTLSQRDRLTRWAMLARTSLELCIAYCPSEKCRQNIAFRHLWTSTFHLNLAGEADRDHILLCLQDLKQTFQSINDPIIRLINNSIMAELSIATIDQEALKLKCMDFFAQVFKADDEDPISMIEAIEPILEPSSAQWHLSLTEEMPHYDSSSGENFKMRIRASITPPKVVSCHLRSIETVMRELEDVKHLQEASGIREVSLLGCLKTLDGIMGKLIPLVLQQPDNDKSYECLDMDHLQSSISAVARLTRILHSFVLYEDAVRVGQISGRDLRGGLAKTLENFKDRMREMYVRCWILLYTLFNEAVSQNKAASNTSNISNKPSEDHIHILRSVHHALGVRSMCRYSQKRFLKLLKSELLDLETKGDYEFDICQVLFDLYGIKFSTSSVDGTTDHGCSPEKLDRHTATMMIDFVMRQANKMNMKDLSKSELKMTIEKMQLAIGPVKPPAPLGSVKASSQSPQLSLNRRVFSAYIKAPINPSHLLRAIQGVTELSMHPVPGENAKIAAKGWYFLLGHATLTKFRAQKRLSPGSISELEDAITFFRQDLDNGTGRWETWYRLAQAYDTKLEEEITWGADKINNSRTEQELAATQRYAIHCYAMAVSVAANTAEPTVETRSLLSDLYTDFGIRLYASSRDPLSMAAFSLEDFSRHFSSQESQQMYKAQPFKEMSRYSVWNFASNLLRKATNEKPKHWITHYFLGKSLWKMFNCDDSLRTTSKPVEVQDVLDAFRNAISALPQRRDSRADPIFEPHFKLLSIVHRLVLGEHLTPSEGSKILTITPWARKVDTPENMDAWKPYILEVIKKFKSADKSNWHHRMSAKAAHIIYDDDKNATTAAAAKHEMSQIFTKTLTIQVWRPEFERPGRHFVYTTRYVYFFVNLLDQLDDRASLDQLLRRVRKKQGDFINHSKLWEDVCLTFAKMIRRAAQINEGHEETVFKPIGWEEFSSKTARLESLNALVPESQAILELIRDALELKKLNNNLMKVTMFEDLIADLYSRVYEVNMPLLVEQVTEENKEKMKVDHLLMTGDTNTEASTPAASLPASDTPAPRGRTKGIARRDIQKRADTIVNLKLAPRTATSKLTSTGDGEQATPTRRGSNAAASSGPTSIAGKHEAAAGLDSGAHGADLNAHRDSGDETEMTDIDESRLDITSSERKPKLFSKLREEVGDTEDDGGSGDEENEENEENEEVEGDEDEEINENEGEGEDEEEGEGDADATEVETGIEDTLDIDDAGNDDEEMQDDEGDETVIEDSRLDDQDDEHEAKVDEEDDPDRATPGEDTERLDAMDTIPA
ncbi:Tetratricopeptide-like helical [Penicillium malachiteum]|uniref:Tetratricopeptide-like helical n=1 Tax=Penicillium malachiteum TaxID=1324776 RepID=UPI00254709D1|nr:Tetratricopeptide-like helical [Penicillium malachiteum]KAJ5736030.1 Tetratricopeptide-like helical [Penicillium malachiteum]